MTDRLVWIDCEMTGLDPVSDALVEIAVIVTDGELDPLDDGICHVIRPPDAALATMNDLVRQMHTDSGLLPLLPDGEELAAVAATVLDYVRRHVPEVRKAPLAGNTVHMDRLFLARDMPELDAHLHYRNVDVSSIKELAKRWYPKIYYAAPAKTGGHRALGDIRDSITELRYYRRALFVTEPGPDTDTARQIAATLAGETTGAE
jgi:oligoribonuclease